MKTIIKLLIILCYIFQSKSSLTNDEGNYELYIRNKTSQIVNMKLYPVSMMFNGNNVYNLVSKGSVTSGIWPRFDYLAGVYHYGDTSVPGIHTIELYPNGEFDFNSDREAAAAEGSYGTIGYGVYKLFIYNQGTGRVDSCLIDFDYYGDYNPGDLDIQIFNDNITPRFKYMFDEHDWVTISYSTEANYTIRSWQPDGPGGSGTKNFGPSGGFKYKVETLAKYNLFSIMPLDSRRDCGAYPNVVITVSQLQDFPFDQHQTNEQDNRSGLLTLNLTIQKNVTTPTVLSSDIYEYANQIIIDRSVYMKIDTGKSFTMIPYTSLNNNVTMTVKGRPGDVGPSSGLLWLENNSTFRIKTNSVLKLENRSRVLLKQGAQLIKEPGGFICNSGAIVSGGFITYQGRQPIGGPCMVIEPNYCVFQDSAKLILSDSAYLELPDSSTITLEGNETALIMNPHSEIRFGKGSKLILKEGARISANNCKFTSLDSNGTWDGIYLEGLSYDTLKYCTIENAVNGINIKDKYNPFGSPVATEISNCTFKNSTSSTLLNYVYINNSQNVIIRNCNSVKTGSGAFTSGIIAEYCPTNGVTIIDNNINYVTTGISLIQSSEYIARNTITGPANAGTGIYLDNSNGTIEYNIVNNFQKSIYGSYSSPYLLKNTLSGASTKGVDLVSSSLPVMKPVVSSGTLRWLAGNNTVTGTPSHSGISFVDCYPLMDSGYNRIIVNGADYMNGTFTMVQTTVYARINHWYDSPPQSALFDVSGGSVNYDYYFDGSTLPSTDGSELNSIGWGLYDTVFTKDLGDSPSAEDLFMQAYAAEMQTEYQDAIELYKEVVSSFKSSSFAPVSISRIFNCLEKDNSSQSDYQQAQSYYAGIKNNSQHPLESRELAEDFVIKSKVKQGLLEDAIDDYNNIYQQNTNNSKGHHALINKLCLENMLSGGDNPHGGNSIENHKLNILSLITGEQIRSVNFANNTVPVQFKLHQNYPNPFNPVTTIKYNIPKDNIVSIKIYDILGRVVFNLNEYKTAGSYEVRFDASNFASGMYFYKIEAGSFTDTKKMVLVK